MKVNAVKMDVALVNIAKEVISHLPDRPEDLPFSFHIYELNEFDRLASGFVLTFYCTLLSHNSSRTSTIFP